VVGTVLAAKDATNIEVLSEEAARGMAEMSEKFRKEDSEIYLPAAESQGYLSSRVPGTEV